MECRLPTKLLSTRSTDWQRFKQEFDIFVIASNNDYALDKTKIALLLNIGGEILVEIFNDLNLSIDGKYDEIVESIQAHCAPQSNVVFERYKMFNMRQEEGETVDSFVQRIKSQSLLCKFKDESITRDIFVIGVANKDVKAKLISKSDLTLVEAVVMANKANELAKEVQVMTKSGNQDSQVDVVKLQNEQMFCKYCGAHHSKGRCLAYNKTCNYCKRQNHFEKVCIKKKKDLEMNTNKVVEELYNMACVDTAVDHQAKDSEEFLLDSITSDYETVKEWTVMGTVNGHYLPLKLDSGAQCNVIPLLLLKRICNKNFISQNLEGTEVNLLAYGNHHLNVFGQITVPVSIKNRIVNIKFIVVNTAVGKAILGINSCIKLNLIVKVDMEK
uniref:Uncharacterized protein n=1 Tax=Cacopsylla melanoneura TaxID=428564 RepID=A0A8D8SZK0_9HEMI